jgi:hypothetical protein
MIISSNILRVHLDYTNWASGRLMEAAIALSPEDLRRDFGTADKTLMGTLVRIFGADRIWLVRVQGQTNPHPPGPEYRDPAVPRPAWQSVAEGWTARAKGRTDKDFPAETAYHDRRGNQWRTLFAAICQVEVKWRPRPSPRFIVAPNAANVINGR